MKSCLFVEIDGKESGEMSAKKPYQLKLKTERRKVKARILWTINDYKQRLSCAKVKESLMSPEISIPAGESETLTFHIKAYFKSQRRGNHLGVFLLHKGEQSLDISCHFAVLKQNGLESKTQAVKVIKRFTDEENCWGIRNAFWNAELKTFSSKKYLPQGKLTLCCTLEIYLSDGLHVTDYGISDAPSLGDSMAKIARNGPFCDVELICENNTRFPCHKTILSARSDVFEAMFSHKETVENQVNNYFTSRIYPVQITVRFIFLLQKNEVLIDDIDSNTLSDFLEFIYTDECGGLPINASNLLILANKYNVQRLKAMCEKAICENIDVANAADVIILAYQNEAVKVKKVSLDFIVNNMNEVSNTQSWQVISKSYPEILNDLILKKFNSFEL